MSDIVFFVGKGGGMFVDGKNGDVPRLATSIELRLRDENAKLETERMDQVGLTLGWRERAEAAEAKVAALTIDVAHEHANNMNDAQYYSEENARLRAENSRLTEQSNAHRDAQISAEANLKNWMRDFAIEREAKKAAEAKVALEHENFLIAHRDNMAAALRIAALTKERDRLIETWNDDHKGVLEHNAALTERVRELEADVQGRIATIEGLHGWKHVADSKLAQMREFVEAASIPCDCQLKGKLISHYEECPIGVALSRLAAPEGKPCDNCGRTAKDHTLGVGAHCNNGCVRKP